MNNALLIEEDELAIDTTVVLKERRAELMKLLGAIDNLSKNPDWQTVKELVFDGMTEKIEKSLQAEAKKNELCTPEIYRLQGKLNWAQRYSDVYKLAEVYKLELNQLTKKLNANATN